MVGKARSGAIRTLLFVGCVAVVTVGMGLTPTPSGAQSGAGASNAPGVTATSINVGSITTETGPLASDFYAMVPGVKAYFDYVNAHGGINGRKLNLAYQLDDGGNPSQFNQLAHTLVDQDHAFAAVGVSSAFFSPGFFTQTGLPTFGYNVTGNWAGPPNLFAAGGSNLYYPSFSPAFAWVANQLHKHSVAVVAYGIASSSDACQTDANRMPKYGLKVSYTDMNVAYPGSGISSDVQRMQQAGSDVVLSCMDIQGNISMARAIQQYGLSNKITMIWLNGYDLNSLQQYPNLMDGTYFYVQHVPFTASRTDYPGLALYLSTMNKYEPKYTYNEVAVQGWESAALFAAGVKAAGSNLTQANLVAQINKLTDFTANGLAPPVNWATGAHSGTPPPPYCSAWTEAVGTQFAVRFHHGKGVFSCFNLNSANLAKPPVGTPGA